MIRQSKKHVTLMNKINKTGFPALFIYDKLEISDALSLVQKRMRV